MIKPNFGSITGTTLELLRTELNSFIRKLTDLLTIPNASAVASDSVGGYTAGWSDMVGQEVRWYKDGVSRLHITGLAQKAAPGFPDTLFTLKEKSRPIKKQTFWIGTHAINVNEDGTVVLASAGTYSGSTNLTGISFLVE